MEILAYSGFMGAFIAITGIVCTSLINLKNKAPLLTLSDSSLANPTIRIITVFTMIFTGLSIPITVFQINAKYTPDTIQFFTILAIITSLLSIVIVCTLKQKIYKLHVAADIFYIITTYLYQLLLFIELKNVLPDHAQILALSIGANILNLAIIYPITKGKIYFEFTFALTAGIYMSTLSLLLI